MKRIPFVLMALAAASLTLAPAAAAQSKASEFIEGARLQIDEFGYDSAYVLLQQGLDPAAGATMAERQRGLVLLGVVALLRSNGADRIGARQAMEQALRVNPAYALPDSLADLHSDARLAFAEARQLVPLPAAPGPAYAEVAPLTVAVGMAPDITLAADTGRFRIETSPNRDARVIVQLFLADSPSEVLWADTQLVRGTGFRFWNLRSTGDSLAVPDGRYAVHVRAIDSLSQVSGTIERILQVSRVPVDTLPHPAPLAPSALLPETLQLRRASPAVLLVGLGVGAAAAVMPSALGNADLNSGGTSDATSFVVAGAASVAGIYGFLTGRRTRPAPENALANAQLRQRHAAQLADVERRNRATLDAAPVRVRVEQ